MKKYIFLFFISFQSMATETIRPQSVSDLSNGELKHFSIRDREAYYKNPIRAQSFVVKNPFPTDAMLRLNDQSKVILRQLIIKRHELPFYEDPYPNAFYTWKEVSIPHRVEFFDSNQMPVKVTDNIISMKSGEVVTGHLVLDARDLKPCAVVPYSDWVSFLKFRYRNQLEGVEFRSAFSVGFQVIENEVSRLPTRLYSHIFLVEERASELNVLIKNEARRRPLEEASCDGLY